MHSDFFEEAFNYIAYKGKCSRRAGSTLSLGSFDYDSNLSPTQSCAFLKGYIRMPKEEEHEARDTSYVVNCF